MRTPMKFLAVPLTPIHIGDGTELLPDHYRLANGEGGREVQLFEPNAVLAAMPPEALQQLARPNLRDIYAELHRRVRPAHVLARIPISGSAYLELQKALSGTQRFGAVQPFIRSGLKPFIPGSSIKGALRTAFLSALAAGNQAVHQKLHQKTMRHKHAVLVREAFRTTRNDTAEDPFRFVHVADVPIPEGRTRIDQVQIISRKPGVKTKGIQMHYERLLSLVDVEKGKYKEVALEGAVIEVDEEGLRACCAARADAAPHEDISWDRLRRAVNSFHWAIWQRERQHFAQYFQQNAHLNRIEQNWLERIKIAQPHTHGVLLRLGRFGHFESKSVEGLRQGYVPQRKRDDRYRRPDEWGDTRTVLPLPTKQGADAVVPFGWLLLVPDNQGTQS